jgi:hypothetical protein
MTLANAIGDALSDQSRRESVSAVHDLVANGLRALDPALEIRATDYFNHTFVPDLVLRWGADGRREERHVHLRYSVSNIAFAEDLHVLAGDDVVFLGMVDQAELSTASWRTQHPSTDGALVTQSVAIDGLTNANARDQRGTRATRQLIRTGHGSVDQHQSSAISESYLTALDQIDTAEAGDDAVAGPVSQALRVLQDFLAEPGQVEVERVLQSEWIRHGRDPDRFPGRDPWRPELLDIESLREVLLALLESPREVEPSVWQRNAGHVRAQNIGEVLGLELRGGRFNEMAHALLAGWTAKWAWAERLPSTQVAEQYDWLIAEERLAVEAGGLRVFFADDGRHSKDIPEGEGVIPTLSEARHLLQEPGLLEVRLESPVEGWRWQPIGVTGPVYERLQGLPDAELTRLHSVRTQVPSTDWAADIDLDRQRIDVKGQATAVATLARLALRFFRPFADLARLDAFLVSGEDPVGDPSLTAPASEIHHLTSDDDPAGDGEAPGPIPGPN